ncbi:zf-CCHC domain-containing protein [Cephalotus follicularis]|uniref:Zf-CCHC domain-containing protein n=1 Tax=Cephalotus follicularis TaxID=3775 RepID=A0A1Q3BUV2_CEPFO|nr:zf-CCHC domain-containing protein [Cephalotus follicularis]
MRQLCVQTQKAKWTRPAPSEWQDGDSSTKSSRNRSQQTAAQGTPSRGSKVKSGNCFYCGHAGHLQKDCWRKNGLCLRCGASNHVKRDCWRGQDTMPTGPCLHCGRNSH